MGSEGLQSPGSAEQLAAARVAELIAELDEWARRAWPGARTPPASMVVAYCAWCAVMIETGDGVEWRHAGAIPPSPAVHTAEPTRVHPPTFPPAAEESAGPRPRFLRNLLREA